MANQFLKKYGLHYIQQTIREFSWKWVGISFAVFLVFEVILGTALLSMGGNSAMWFASLYAKFEVFLQAGSFFLGGLLIGLISRDVRILEPCIGAVLSASLVLISPSFMPGVQQSSGTIKIVFLFGSALVLSFLGARTGERFTKKIRG